MAKELKQHKGESLEHFIERVANKWDKAGEIELNGETVATKGKE